MGSQYGPYVMYFLSQMLQNKKDNEQRQSAEQNRNGDPQAESHEKKYGDNNLFGADETGAQWHRQTDVELLKKFCREGYAQAKKHGHFIIGNGSKGDYIGIPGRFLIEEQPAAGVTGFTLWQPLKGGEEMYEKLEDMNEEAAERIYGYWIAAIDSKTLKVSEV